MRTLIVVLLSVAIPCLPLEARRRWIPPASTASSATFSDNFTRADANPISNPSSSGGTWGTAFGFSAIKILSNKGSGSVSGGFSASMVSAPTFTDQHSASITLGQAVGADTYMGPCVRYQNGATTYYMLSTRANSTDLMIFKVVAGSGTQIGSTITGLSLTTGSVLKLDVSGTSTVTVNAYVDGVLKGTATDSSSPLAGGQPAFQCYETSTTSGGSISAFSATDF